MLPVAGFLGGGRKGRRGAPCRLPDRLGLERIEVERPGARSRTKRATLGFVSPVSEIAGLLLTGGAGRRMGRDKAELVVGGVRLADRAAAALAEVCDPVLEVGPGWSPLDAVQEDPAGSGPLAAVAAGGRALGDRGHRGPALVLAVDMPAVDVPLLRFLATFPGIGTVVPFVDGHPQPLCARYSAEALVAAGRLAAEGQTSMRALVAALSEVQWAGPRMWGRVATEAAFLDLDLPEDLGPAPRDDVEP
jgi:molybdenum cofactor guanylyltransferase